MKSKKQLKKFITLIVIVGFFWQMTISLPAQSEEEIDRQFQKAKARYLSGQYVNAKTRIERIINIIIGRNISRNDILGGCYLLLGAIYEKEDKEVLAEENYHKAKEDFGMMLVSGVDLNSLPLYRKIVKGEVQVPQGTIEKEGNKKKKKFPWLLAAAGAVAVGIVLYLLLRKSKSKNLKVELDNGVQGTPTEGNYKYKKGEVISYSYETLPGFDQLHVYLDNQQVEPSGQITMNDDHKITVGATANTVTIITDKDLVEVPEGDTASFNIKLSAQPQSDVNVTIVHIDGDTDFEVIPESRTFTSSDWNTFKSVNLTAAEDQDALNGEAVFQISAPDIQSKNITAREIDNDTLRFLTDPNNLTIAEGKSASIKVKLSAKPTANITAQVNRYSGENDIIVSSGQTLKFDTGNWNRNHEVTFSALQDADVESGSTTFRISAPGVANKEIIVTEIDDDGLGFIINPNDQPLKVEEGSTRDIQITLSAQPSNTITASVSRISGDKDIDIQGGGEKTLNFSPANYDQGQTVTLAAAQDDDTEQGTTTFRISAAGSELADRDFNAQEVDDDALQFVTDTEEVTIDEDGTAGFQVKLSAKPGVDVNVTVSRSDGDNDISVLSGASLNFGSNNWNAYQTVTLQAVKDEDEENGEAQIGITAEDIPTKKIIARENDNYRGNPPEINISEPENDATVSGDVTIKATATDDFGSPRVEFYIDNELKETISQPYYHYVWPTKSVTTGPHQIKVIAYDSLDQTAEDEISVTIEDDPPTVTITPPDTSPLSGTVTIQTDAEDYIGVQTIDVYIDGTPLTSWAQSPQEQVTFNFQLDTTGYSNGNHTLKAVAIDTANQESTPSEISITIEN